MKRTTDKDPGNPPLESHEAIEYLPVTKSRWEDLETLFGPRGAVGGCWCMHWRSSPKAYEAHKGDGNKHRLRQGINSGDFHGVLAYADGVPIGWCAVGPRTEFPRLERSRIARRVDQRSVWSIVCFYVSREHRRIGVSSGLIKAAVNYAAQSGADIIEAYPVEPKADSLPPLFAFTGLAKSFIDAGFSEVARRGETRPFMRYYIHSSDSRPASS